MKKNVTITSELNNMYATIRPLFKVSAKAKSTDTKYDESTHKARAKAIRQLLKDDVFMDFVEESTEQFRSYFSASEDASISFDLLRSSKTCLLEHIASTDSAFKAISTCLVILEDAYQYNKELDNLLTFSAFLASMEEVIKDYRSMFDKDAIWTQYQNKLRATMTTEEKGLNQRLFDRQVEAQKYVLDNIIK